MTKPTHSAIDSLCVNTLRFLAVDAVEKARSGHPGTPMEAAGLGYVLWTKVLRHDPENPAWPNRDRFILSAGHASMLLYGLLHLTGYPVSLDDLKNFRQWDSKTPGHPEAGHTPGVETTTGPLGQGFATGVGMAMAERLMAARFNRPDMPVVDHAVWAFVSDGDIMEGLSSEAASLAGHLKLGKIKYVYLDNAITIEGSTGLAFSEDVAKRFEAYGWRTVRIPDPENLSNVEAVLKDVQSNNERPTLVLARTHIGFGAPNKQDTAEAHGAPLGPAETALAKKNLNWPQTPTFFVPDDARTHWGRAKERGTALRSAWDGLLRKYKSAYPDFGDTWESLRINPLPLGWETAVPVFKKGDDMATRQASGKTIQSLAARLENLVGGSADLAPSNNTFMDGAGHFSADETGRNFHFGIREHAMGAILNGIALYGGFIPFGGTFLTFADYMRPAIRLAALMKLGVIYVFTHDSIGVGEDGPTHQPVEHVASLRCIPGLSVIRPADANETAQAWKTALARRDGPTALILSRQKLPTLDRTVFSGAEGCRRGGYRLDQDPAVDVLLIATGSEVALALAARERLAQDKITAGVVSLPSHDLFEQQDAAYRQQVLPDTVKTRVAIEAGVSFGWDRWTGSAGEKVTLDRYGASAPGEIVQEKLGFTVEAVVVAAKKSIARSRS